MWIETVIWAFHVWTLENGRLFWLRAVYDLDPMLLLGATRLVWRAVAYCTANHAKNTRIYKNIDEQSMSLALPDVCKSVRGRHGICSHVLSFMDMHPSAGSPQVFEPQNGFPWQVTIKFHPFLPFPAWTFPPSAGAKRPPWVKPMPSPPWWNRRWRKSLEATPGKPWNSMAPWGHHSQYGWKLTWVEPPIDDVIMFDAEDFNVLGSIDRSYLTCFVLVNFCQYHQNVFCLFTHVLPLGPMQLGNKQLVCMSYIANSHFEVVHFLAERWHLVKLADLRLSA